jgi:uridylate kinase
VILAERFSGDTIINLSNIEKVYTADPKKDPNAKPLDHVSWKNFRKIVGVDWNPGSNFPFDPIATKRAATLGLRVIAAGGKDLENLKKILRDEPFEGSQIGPE